MSVAGTTGGRSERATSTTRCVGKKSKLTEESADIFNGYIVSTSEFAKHVSNISDQIQILMKLVKNVGQARALKSDFVVHYIDEDGTNRADKISETEVNALLRTIQAEMKELRCYHNSANRRMRVFHYPWELTKNNYPVRLGIALDYFYNAPDLNPYAFGLLDTSLAEGEQVQFSPAYAEFIGVDSMPNGPLLPMLQGIKTLKLALIKTIVPLYYLYRYANRRALEPAQEDAKNAATVPDDHMKTSFDYFPVTSYKDPNERERVWQIVTYDKNFNITGVRFGLGNSKTYPVTYDNTTNKFMVTVDGGATDDLFTTFDAIETSKKARDATIAAAKAAGTAKVPKQTKGKKKKVWPFTRELFSMLNLQAFTPSNVIREAVQPSDQQMAVLLKDVALVAYANEVKNSIKDSAKKAQAKQTAKANKAAKNRR